jgi:hypothetical protein
VLLSRSLSESVSRAYAGLYVKVSGDVPAANLHLTLMERLGIPIEKLGNSVSPLSI